VLPVLVSVRVRASSWPVPFSGGDLGAGADVDVGCGGDLVDQVLRHPGGQGVAADHDRDLLGVPCQVDRGLACGVGPAGDEDVLAGEGGVFGCGRPVEDTGAEQGVQAGASSLR
jgi:hypothetical protein